MIVHSIDFSMHLWQYSCYLFVYSAESGRYLNCESTVGTLFVIDIILLQLPSSITKVTEILGQSCIVIGIIPSTHAIIITIL